ncbi:phytoene desaturase [Bacillus timonensis]|nr:phytoene desaturase [Bacillus timonensis]
MKIGIVGGGVGGLTTALLLRKQGHEVTIFEKEEQLGGRLAFVKHGNFKIDEGPTIVLLPDMLLEILELAGIAKDDIQLIPCDPLYQIHYGDGTSFTKYKDEQKHLAEIEEVFPGEGAGYKKFLEVMKTRFALGKSAFLEKQFSSGKDFWTVENVKTLSKLKAYQSIHSMLDSFFSEEKLKQAYSLQTLYIGGNPLNTPAMYALVPYSEHAHGIYYLHGGYASLVEILKQKLVEEGITIKLSESVDHLIIKQNQVKGIQTNYGTYEFNAVVVNGDYPSMESLLPEIKRKEKSYTPSSGCVLLYMGLNKRYEDAPIHQFFLGGDFEKNMKEIFEEKVIPTDPAYYTFNPSVIDHTLAPNGKSVLYTLVPVPSGSHIDWSIEKENVKERILHSMEARGFPGVKDAIEWIEIRSPLEAKQSGLYEGGSFGIAPTLFQSGVFRPQIKRNNVRNLYAVGASVHPGGGIPIVLQGAKLLAQVIEKDMLELQEKRESEDVWAKR